MLGNNYSYPDQIEKAQTQKPPNQSLILIDNFDRFRLNSDGVYEAPAVDGTYNNYVINHQKIAGFGKISKLAITELTFDWVTPNINMRNNYFTFGYNNGTNDVNVWVQVPEGWYTAQQLAPILQNLLNNVGGTFLYELIQPNINQFPNGNPSTYGVGTWSVAVDANNKFTLSNTNNTILFIPTSNIPVDTDVNNMVGFSSARANNGQKFISPTSAFQNFINSYTGAIAKMTYTEYIDVCSDSLCRYELVRDNLTQFNYTNILCRIYLSDVQNQPYADYTVGTKPFKIYRQFQNPKWIRWNGDDMINTIDIKYYDDSGNLLYIPQKECFDARQLFTTALCEQ